MVAPGPQLGGRKVVFGMSKVVVLGGSRGVGSVAVRALASGSYFDSIVIADRHLGAAEALAASIAKPGVTAAGFDAISPESLASVIEGASVVLNCAGPFYALGPRILDAVIKAKINYVDVCDDLAPTRTMLEMDGAAKAAGVSALIGMGNSPGLANVFVSLCAQMLLDEVESVDIMHLHGGEPEEGPAVVKHRIFAMVNDIPLFLDGEMKHVRQLEPSGQAVVVDTDFPGVGTFPVYPYPHPETITLPRYFPKLRRATNLGVIFPLSYFQLTQDMVRAGACSDKPIQVGDAQVIPLEFSVAHILSQRARFLEEAGITGPGGCLKVVVSGLKDGVKSSYVFALSSKTAGAGEGTGIPAAAGAILMQQGKITTKGVFPPEGGVGPFDLLPLALGLGKKMGATSGDGILLEHIDQDGKRTVLPLSM